MIDVHGKRIEVGDYLILTRVHKGGPGLTSPSEQTKVKVSDINKEEIFIRPVYHNAGSMSFRISHLQNECIIRKFNL